MSENNLRDETRAGSRDRLGNAPDQFNPDLFELVSSGLELVVRTRDGVTLYPSLYAGSVGTSDLEDGAVTAPKIGGSAVVESKINNGAVTEGKIGTNAVTNSKIGTGAVDSDELATDAVTHEKVSDNAIDTDELATDAVTNVKVADNAIDTAELVDNAVTVDKIAPLAVDTAQLALSAVETAQILDDAITNEKILAGAVSAESLTAKALAYPADSLEAYYSLDDVADVADVIDTSGNNHHATRVGFGPVARYTFDADSIVDDSGNGNDGTGVADLTYENSDYGRAAVFNGTTSHFDLPAAVYGIFNPINSFSFSARIKLDTLDPAEASARMIEVRNSGGGYIMRVLYSTALDAFYFSLTDGVDEAECVSPTNSATTEWTDIVAVWDAGTSTATLYTDGIEQASEINTNVGANVPNNGWIGGISTANNLDGSIDEVRFYDYALTPESAVALHDRPTAPAEVVAGIARNALVLNGVDQYVTLPSGAYSIIDDDVAWSLSTWFKPNTLAPGDNGVLFSFEGTGYVRLFFNDSVDRIMLAMDSGAGQTNLISANNSVTINWHHVVITFDGIDALVLYLDGISVDNNTHSDSGMAITSGAFGELSVGGSNFDGLFDETRIFSRALTAAEVASLFRFPGGMEAGVIHGSFISADTIVGTQIVAGSIGTDHLVALAITADKIDALAVTAAKINVGTLSAIAADVGTVTAGIIRSTNWAAGAGVEFDLSTGRLRMGGSSAPKVDFNPDAGTYSFTGEVTATGTITNVSGSKTITIADGKVEFTYAAGVTGQLEAYTNTVIRLYSGSQIVVQGAVKTQLTGGSSGIHLVAAGTHIHMPNNTDFLPDTTGGCDLGSSAKRFGNLYLTGIVNAQSYITSSSYITGTYFTGGYSVHTNASPVGNSSIGHGTNDTLDKIHIRSVVGDAREMDYSSGW